MIGAMNLRPTATALGTAVGRSCRAQLQRAINFGGSHSAR